MRYLLVMAFMLAGLGGLAPGSAKAALVCPTTTNTNSDCGFVITIGAGGAISGAAVTGAAPYDGSDDALVGVVNSSGSVYTGSFTLTGSGNGGGLFAFDADGICSYTSAAYCSSAPTGYEGPLNTFTSISSGGNSGTVSFAGAGIAVGGSSFFSLEGSPASIAMAGGIGTPGTPGSTVPEPATFAILSVGLVGLMSARLRRS